MMFKKIVPLVVSFGLLVQPFTSVHAETAEKVTVLQQEKTSNGIMYEEQRIENYGGKDGYKQRLNFVEADLNTPGVSIASGKALEKINGMESIKDQANRERVKGKNVVAAINADMYNMQTGMNMSVHIQDGNLLTSHLDPASVRTQPVFGVDANNQSFIDTLSVEGMLKVEAQEKKIDVLNRNENGTNKLGIYTSQLNQKEELSFYDLTNTYTKDGAIAVVSGVQNPEQIKAGVPLKGTITKIYTAYERITIPKNGVAIAGFGTQAKWIRDTLKMDQEISIEFNVYKGAARELRNDIVTAIGGYDWLVKNGKALELSEFKAGTNAHVKDPNARTSIGITADNKVIAMTVDKPSTLFSDAVGLTLPEVGKVFEKYGVVSALSLDGGGSTEMVVQPEGEKELKVANTPSDGSSRKVTNSILFVSNAEQTPDVGKVLVEKDIAIFKNSAYSFQAKATDANGNALNTSNRDLKWSATKGSITENGEYTAPPSAGEGTVSAEIDGMKGEAQVTVVDTVDDFQFKDTGLVILQQGEKKEFAVNAQKDGKPVILSSSSIEWDIPSEAGTMDDKGILTIKDSVPNGTTFTFKAKIGSTEKTVNVMVGLKEQIIDNYETYPKEGYHVNGFVGGTFELSNEQKKSGDKSIKVSYDTKTWTRQLNGTINITPHWYKDTAPPIDWSDELADQMYATYKTDIMPKKFGMWVYGDGKAPWARAIFKVNGANKTLDLAPSINWNGWKYLEVDIPQNWELPIVFNYMYMVETNKTKPNYSGSVYIDDMRFIYTDEEEDFSGPAFTEVLPSGSSIYSDTLEFSAVVTDAESGVDPTSIEVLMDGKKTDFAFDEKTGKISGQVSNLAAGTYAFTIKANDKKGNAAVPFVDKKITVDLTADSEKPVVSNVTPAGNAAEQSPMTRITFRAKDAKSGLDATTISVTIDGKKAEVYYDAATGWAYALPGEKLSDGVHQFTIDAKDKSGNQADTISKSFTVTALPQPSNPENFNISVIPDTQGNMYSNPIFDRVTTDPSDLVIHVGDIVDTSSEADWIQAKANIDRLKGKPFIMVPGNHESFKGDLNFYNDIIGSPTYHMEYGNTAIIGLNSAFGQSISASDSTQFHYLQKVLDENKQKNVLVVNHVITKDDYGTAHEMNPSDARKFEEILGNYKKANPEVNVQVLFGHLHMLQEWEIDGVKYTITGNAAGKGYVTNNQGNILGTGLLNVSNEGMDYQFNPYLTTVSIVDPALNNKREMKIAKGAARSLKLFGDFREISGSYIVDISQFEPVKIDWTSSNPDVLKVNAQGEITAIKEGSATVTAVSGGKTNSVTVQVENPSSIKPIKLDVELSKTQVYTGENVELAATATDMYDNKFALDPKELKLSLSPAELAAVMDNGSILTKSAGALKIDYSYGKFAGSKSLTIMSIPSAPTTDPEDEEEENPEPEKPQEPEMTIYNEPKGRLIVKQPVSIFKMNADGSETLFRVVQAGETLRVYGNTEDLYSVGGDYYVRFEQGKMAMYEGRILIKEAMTLYAADGKAYRQLKVGEAIKVYGKNNGKYEVGGGYYVKPAQSAVYYEGMVKINANVKLMLDGVVKKTLKSGETYRVYGQDGKHLLVGGGYYLEADRTTMTYLKN